MEIQQKLLKFKYHIVFALALALAFTARIVLAPSFLTILAYFWPLLSSTALFLVAVIFFGKTSRLPPSDVSSSSSSSSLSYAGEGLLDYVAGPLPSEAEAVAAAALQESSHHHQHEEAEAAAAATTVEESTFKSDHHQ